MRASIFVLAVLLAGCDTSTPCEQLHAEQPDLSAACLAAEFVPHDDTFLADTSQGWPLAFEMGGRAGSSGTNDFPDGTRVSGQPWGLYWTVPAGDPNAESVVDRIRTRPIRRDSVGAVSNVAVTPGGGYAFGLGDGRTVVRDAEHVTLLEVQAPTAPQDALDGTLRPNGFRRVAFSDDGRRIALGDETGAVEVWDVERRERLWASTFESQALSVAAGEDGALVAVGTNNGALHVLDGATGAGVTTWALPGPVIRVRLLAPDVVVARAEGSFTSESDLKDQARRMGDEVHAPGGVTGPDLVSAWRVPGR